MYDNTSKNPLFLSIENDEDHQRLSQLCHALSSPERLKILQFLQHKNRSLSEISREIGLPFSSVSRHIDVLYESDLIDVHYQPTQKGHSKFYCPKLQHFQIILENLCPSSENSSPEIFIEMPIGMFSHCDISSHCGMLSQTGPIGEFNDPGSLFSPERSKAECLWFNYGSISYNFPTSYLHNREVSEISFTFEICSETPYFNNNWPSDITVSVNSFELLTFTSPGDFGGKRGKYTPEFWPVISTQFGLLKKIRINSNGVFLDEVLINDSITLDKLNLLSENSIEFSLAVKKDAVHCGGMNLFGANFGNYPQHIIMGIR